MESLPIESGEILLWRIILTAAVYLHVLLIFKSGVLNLLGVYLGTILILYLICLAAINL